jgi:ATP-dependent helicase YprA (DUF1998 family)
LRVATATRLKADLVAVSGAEFDHAAVHAAEHALAALAPLIVPCDVDDLGMQVPSPPRPACVRACVPAPRVCSWPQLAAVPCQCVQCTRRKGDVHREKLLLFERSEGGSGLVQGLAGNFAALIRLACQTVGACECESGCPSCIHLSCCGEYNEVLSKAGALVLLQHLRGVC